MRVPLPDGAPGVWREARWTNDVTPRTLERVEGVADPPSAFRQVRVYRVGGDLLANASWDPSRTRAVQIWPADATVAPGETLVIKGCAWSEPVALTAVLRWA